MIDIGLAPTPLTGFAIKLYGADAGVTITASHNPPEYNGIKVWQANGMAYTSEMERELESIMDSGNFKKAPWNEIGTLRRADPSEEYINAALKFVKLENSYTVVLDSGNGAGSVVSPPTSSGSWAIGLSRSTPTRAASSSGNLSRTRRASPP